MSRHHKGQGTRKGANCKIHDDKEEEIIWELYCKVRDRLEREEAAKECAARVLKSKSMLLLPRKH